MLKLENVSKIYTTKKGIKTIALDNINLTFSDTGMYFILGKSGSGKSTLLNIIGGLDKMSIGEITFFNQSFKKFKVSDYENYRNNYIGFIFQDFNLLNEYNLYDNIVLSLKIQDKKTNKENINNLLKKLEIQNLVKRNINELSGGEKQRVAIARALIKNPKVILADEPTGNLDVNTGTQVMELLKEISKEMLVIVITHDNVFANKYGDKIISISDGRITENE